MSDWLDPSPVRINEEFFNQIGGHPLIAESLVRRGFSDIEAAKAFIDPGLYTPTNSVELPDLELAVNRLFKAIQRQEKIMVWGDFDVDGQTATTLLVSTLQHLGAQVDYYIPVRARESHGVHIPKLKEIIERGDKVLLTCDTGITAHEAVAYAQSHQVDVIITDHHELSSSLPSALAVINPKRLFLQHPFYTLPGVGVAFKLAEALYDRSSDTCSPELLLDLVALGIVADVASLVGETRYLLQKGLHTLRNTSRLGLQVLMEFSELSPVGITEEHIGFVLGPRLNALGRLADANSAVEFLTTRDQTRARILANELEALNAQRKLLTDQVFQGALSQIERDPDLLKDDALVLAHPSWPAGVIGIVASRLVDYFHKPVILISSPPGEIGRGSARSIPGVDIIHAITSQADLLEGYGGHTMAAGLAILPERIPQFRQGFSQAIARQLDEIHLQESLQVDGYISLPEITPEFVKDIERLAPFGPGNPPLLLVSRDLVLNGHKTIGRYDEHLLLDISDPAGNEREVIWWQGTGLPLPEGRFDLAYTIHSRNYRGQNSIQMTWVEAKPTQEAGLTLTALKPALQIVDYRQETNPLSIMRNLHMQGELEVWCEGGKRIEPDGKNRLELIPSKQLAIWTIPPGRNELKEVLDRVQPEVLYLFSVNPGMDDPEPFLQRLVGLVKFVISKKEGLTQLSRLAAETAQRSIAVIAGLEWMQERGMISGFSQEEDQITLLPSLSKREVQVVEKESRLGMILEETAAYRNFYLRTRIDNLI